MSEKQSAFLNVRYRKSMKSRITNLCKLALSSEILKRILQTIMNKIAIVAITFAITVVVSRVLGPEGRGFFAVATTIGALGVQFGNLGIQSSNTYYVAGNRKLLPALIGNSLFISFVFGGLSAGLLWTVFLIWPKLAPVHGLLLDFAILLIPFTLAYLFMQSLLLGIYEVKAYNKIELTYKALSIGLIGLLVMMGIVNVEAIFFTGLVAVAISFLWSLWSLKKHYDGPPLLSFQVFKQHFPYGFTAYLSILIGFLIIRGDLLMVKQMLDAKQAGLYSIAVSLGDLVILVPTVVGTIIFPKLSAMSCSNDKWMLTKKASVVTGLTLALIILFAVLFVRPLVRLFFGEAFIPVIPSFLYLMPGIFVFGVENVLSQYLNSMGRPKIIIAMWLFTFALKIILNLRAIPELGIVGASIASSISYFVVFALTALIVRRVIVRQHNYVTA